MTEPSQQVRASGCPCGGAGPCTCNDPGLTESGSGGGGRPASAVDDVAEVSASAATPCAQVRPSSFAPAAPIYAIGTLGYDFSTEARRDSFKQLMPAFDIDGTQVPANPYDARQMADHLQANLSEASSLIWTLNVELTPIYAIAPVGPFAREVYAGLQELLAGQVLVEGDDDFVERVSIPGHLGGRKVRLFSGQEVPLITIDSPRGLFGWKVNSLVTAAVSAVVGDDDAERQAAARRSLHGFLNRVYYDLRNLGQRSRDRALNFAATNAFQAAQSVAEAVGAGMELESIQVDKSPFCRMDSDCWEVVIRFFDPENLMRAKKLFRFTIDVSDVIPVTLGEVRSWSAP